MRLNKEVLKNKLNFWVDQTEINNWFKDKNIFFILAMGRSGTKFLAHLLNKSKEAYVVHEPVYSDFQAYQEAFYSEEKGLKYIRNFRKKEIYLRIRNKGIKTYGEVNSALRRHYNALKEEFPNATFIHLIRDGRDVVRSAMSRWTMTSKDPNTKLIHPTNGDPYKERWSEMSRFEKLCWYWQVDNHYLRENIGNPVKFEDLLRNYEYFKNNILEKIGINISKEVWIKEVNNPKNTTKEYSIPPWKNWDKKKTKYFEEICGKEMGAYGYEIE